MIFFFAVAVVVVVIFFLLLLLLQLLLLLLLDMFNWSCLRRGSGEDRDPRRLGKRETVPDATLSPPQ